MGRQSGVDSSQTAGEVKTGDVSDSEGQGKIVGERVGEGRWERIGHH